MHARQRIFDKRSDSLNLDFFIVGAPKSGTTALHHYLSSHPFIFLPAIKELNYFCFDLPKKMRKCYDFDSYRAFFSDAPAGALTGEISAWYVYSEEAVPQIMQLFPEAKIVVILRNPVEMARSLHGQHIINLAEDMVIFRKRGRRSPIEPTASAFRSFVRPRVSFNMARCATHILNSNAS